MVSFASDPTPVAFVVAAVAALLLPLPAAAAPVASGNAVGAG